MRAKVIGLGTVAALALGACGGSGATLPKTAPTLVVRDPAQLIAASADATTNAKSARMTGDMTMDVLGRKVSFTIDGTTAFDNSRADIKMDMSAMLGMIPGAPAKLVVEARMVDGAMYMNFGDMMRAIAGGRELPPSLRAVKWLKIDVSKLTKGGAGSSPSSFTQYLEYLRGVAKGGVQTVGSDTVRGVTTTHYTAAIDLQQAMQHINRGSALGRLAADAAK